MKNIFIILISFLFTSCFIEPKKIENEVQKNENDILKNEDFISNEKFLEKNKTLDSIFKPMPGVDEYLYEDFYLKQFDLSSEITKHYSGCGCYFSNNKKNYISRNKNVFFGTILGNEGSNIELIIEKKIVKLFFIKEEKYESEIYYKYANSKHEATIKLKNENTIDKEVEYLTGIIVVDNKYISELFGRCGC
jgi:hypothetical protein